MARSATSHVGLSIYCLDLDGPRLAVSKAVTKNCSHSTIELKHLGESEMSDESNAGRTEDREMLRETLSRMQDETRRGMEELRRNPRTTADIETNAGFISAAQGKLRHLDEAMVRFDAGKYGQCLKCSGAILIERLTAIPFAAYCINCQKKLNRDRAGWGHAPHDDEWTIPDELEPSTERESRQSAGASEHLSIPEKRACRIGSTGTA